MMMWCCVPIMVRNKMKIGIIGLSNIEDLKNVKL